MAMFSKSQKMRFFLAIFLLLLATCGCGAWYFFYYTKTPEYGLEKIRMSFEKHDWQTFEKYVDLDALLGNSTETLIQAMIDTDRPMSGDAKAAMNGFVQMFKAPLALTLRTEVQYYVEHGEWKNSGTASETQDPMSLDMVLTRIGLKTIQFRNIDYVATDRETGTARAGVRVYQADIGEEFIFEVKLVQGGDGVWRVTEIQNLHDFVAMIAKAHDAILADYLAKSQAIIDAHGKSVQEIEQEFSNTLQKGSLGNDETRQALKTIMLEKAAADWTQRKAELSDLTVPPMADTLHHLRLRSCDMRIAYILGYAAWLDDKEAATIREAQAKLKQAKTLENEAAALARHMSGQSNAVSQPLQKPMGNETLESTTELQ